MSSEEEIWPEVDELKTELLQALAKVDTAASFSCKGVVPHAPNPGIEVEGLGVLGLPLSSRDAELLISKCRQSPFGKGEDTIVDDSVRQSWELDPSQFSLTNLAWSTSLAGIVDAVHRDLGLTCHRVGIKAQLYKLLIYESGAFFKPHQDLEKAPGMFGTLVICLPSKHEGGRVMLTHNKRKYEFSTSASSQFGTTFGAWYSDVLHEVEEVTSGHRVVLTYNLIRNFSLPQKAPDADSKARIKRVLRLWEQASADNEPDYPPYIVHQLDYFYSKNSANIGMLKGHDAAQVRCLESACRELGYGIYLAVFERTIQRDDECGDEEFDRQEEFEYMTELDGTPLDRCPEYDSTCRLEDYDSDKEADESEHEGYTGNEGAPSTFWYRQTVVLLVSPCRKLGFGWTSDNKYKFAEHHIDVLQSKAGEDPIATKQLYRLCHLLLPDASEISRWNRPRANFGWSSYRGGGYQDYEYLGDAQTKRCLTRIGKLTLQNSWLDLYDRVPIEQKTSSDCLEALGAFLCSKGANIIGPQMSRLIKLKVNLADKYRLLQQVTQAFNDKFVMLSSEVKYSIEFDAWYSTAFAEILGTQERASKDDGAILGEIARTCQAEVGEQILRKLKSASTQTIAAFIISLTKKDPELAPTTHHTLIEAAVDLMWEDFEYAEPSRTHGAPVEALNQYELADLIDLTKKHGQTTVSDALKVMSDALAKVNENYIAENLFSFIHSIVNHEIPSLIVEDDPSLFDAVADYIQHTLYWYIRRLVGNEPQKPKDWSLPDRGCNSCRFCHQVGAFMADGKQQTFREQFNGSIGKHLDREFNGYRSSNDYDISIDNSVRPFFWICKKIHRNYNTSNYQYKKNRQEAQNKLKSFGGIKSNLLKTYLGEQFDAFMSCQMENLPELSSQTLPEGAPLRNTDASNLNTSNGMKRKLNSYDVDGKENDNSTKRIRIGDIVSAPAEVIDLT